MVFDLTQSSQFVCAVTNTASRIEEISAEVLRLLELGTITQVEAQKLRGRMQFADAQIFGRTGKRCTACLRDFACRRRSCIGDRDATFLKLFLSSMKSEDPRVVTKSCSQSVIMVTDACYERDARDLICGLGGLVVDEFSGMKQYFSCQLSEDQRVLLGELQKKQIIFEAESLCAVLAYCLWTEKFAGRMSFLYVDNEGTKFSLIKGSSENPTVDAIAQVFIEAETHTKTVCWLARVSSFSNIADAPSRGDNKLLDELGFTNITDDASKCLQSLCLSVKEKMGKTAGQASPNVQNMRVPFTERR